MLENADVNTTLCAFSHSCTDTRCRGTAARTQCLSLRNEKFGQRLNRKVDLQISWDTPICCHHRLYVSMKPREESMMTPRRDSSIFKEKSDREKQSFQNVLFRSHNKEDQVCWQPDRKMWLVISHFNSCLKTAECNVLKNSNIPCFHKLTSRMLTFQ